MIQLLFITVVSCSNISFNNKNKASGLEKANILLKSINDFEIDEFISKKEIEVLNRIKEDITKFVKDYNKILVREDKYYNLLQSFDNENPEKLSKQMNDNKKIAEERLLSFISKLEQQFLHISMSPFKEIMRIEKILNDFDDEICIERLNLLKKELQQAFQKRQNSSNKEEATNIFRQEKRQIFNKARDLSSLKTSL